VPAGAHAGKHRLGRPQGPDRGEVKQFRQLPRRRGLDRGVEDHARVRDQDVDLPGLPDSSGGTIGVGDVEREPLGDIEVVERPWVPGGGHHAVAAAGSGPRQIP
jgi:hypothetical protein